MEKTLSFSGDLTIQHIASLQSELAQALAGDDPVQVDLSAAQQVDTAFIQLLCCAHRTAVFSQRRLELKGPLPEAFLSLLQDTGFVRHIGCRGGDCREDCIWMSENLETAVRD